MLHFLFRTSRERWSLRWKGMLKLSESLKTKSNRQILNSLSQFERIVGMNKALKTMKNVIKKANFLKINNKYLCFSFSH